MKKLLFLLIGILISYTLFLMWTKPDTINLEGNWKTTKFEVDGKDVITANPINNYFDNGNEANFNYWTDSLTISTLDNKKFSAKFVIENHPKNINTLLLSSKDPFLNGIFTMDVDTTHLGPQEYMVTIELESNITKIQIQRHKVIPPWKPEKPRRGQI